MERIRRKIKNNKILYKVGYPIVFAARYIRGVYLQIGWFYIKILLRKIHIIKYDQVLGELEDQYKGQHKRIFVVATGPSLRIEDLEWLEKNQEISISFNGIFKMFDKVDWRPDYYVMDDYWLYRSYKKKKFDIQFEKFAKNKVILSEPMKKELDYDYDTKKIGFVPMCYYDHWFTNKSERYNYSRDLKNGHYDLYTVTNLAINLADYMGVEEVYLLGVDCSFASGALHCGEAEENQEKKNIEKLLEQENAQRRGYHELHKRITPNGIRIYNATRGGLLEEFERVDMDKLIEQSN